MKIKLKASTIDDIRFSSKTVARFVSFGAVGAGLSSVVYMPTLWTLVRKWDTKGILALKRIFAGLISGVTTTSIAAGTGMLDTVADGSDAMVDIACDLLFEPIFDNDNQVK